MVKRRKGGKEMLASLLSWIGSLSASAGTKACWVWLADEPKMPKSLLNK